MELFKYVHSELSTRQRQIFRTSDWDFIYALESQAFLSNVLSTSPYNPSVFISIFI